MGCAASGAALLRGLRCFGGLCRFGGCGIAKVYVMVVGVGLQTASKAVARCRRVSVPIDWSWRKVAKHEAGELPPKCDFLSFSGGANPPKKLFL